MDLEHLEQRIKDLEKQVNWINTSIILEARAKKEKQYRAGWCTGRSYVNGVIRNCILPLRHEGLHQFRSH